jgi:lysophospholipase L1-like esterase
MSSIFLRGLLILSFAACGACALEPTPRPDPARFAGEIAAFEKQQPGNGGIVFTGSSSIRMWRRLKQDFPGLPVVNRGFGGCVTHDMIHYFDVIVGREKPKVLVTYSGNDIAKKISVNDAFADYTEFLTMSHDRLPKIRVILTSVKIAPRRASEIPKVHQLNELLEKWCVDKGWVRYLDCTSYLADDTGKPIPSYFRADGLHLAPSGYEKWRVILDPVLREEWAKMQ